LTHDVADHKFVSDNRQEVLLAVLEEATPENAVPKIVDAWENISWSKGKTPSTLEGRVVQDADRLDALGAIGILRTAAYSGHKGRVLVDPLNFSSPGTTTGHFYDKLLKLKDSMNTKMGRALAEERHAYMISFLEQLDRELQ